MNFFKNHTGIVSALILGVAVVSSAFLLTREAPLTDRAVASPSSALRSQITEKDSDNDGLLDWEETLWGTDPFLVDTDGDGILDGEFVASRKKDKTPEEIIAFEDLSFTSQFSRTFFGEYLQYQDDGTLTDIEKNALIARLANSVKANLPSAFSNNSVRTVVANEDSLRAYVIAIALAIQEATPKDVSDSELVLLETALAENKSELFSDIAKIAKGYETLGNTLAQIETPSTLRANHANLVTAVERLAAIIEALSNAETDAVYALAVLPEYKTEAGRLGEALQIIGSELSKHSINTEDQIISARQVLGL